MDYRDRPTAVEIDHYTYKPLNRLYQWVGFLTFWGALGVGVYQLIKYVIWANAFIDASLK